MYKIKTMNKITKHGLDIFAKEKYQISDTEENYNISKVKLPKKYWMPFLYYGVGIKDTPPVDGKLSFASDLHFTMRRKISYTNGYGGGFGILYNNGIEKTLKENFKKNNSSPDSEYVANQLNNFSPEVHTNWSMYFGKIIFDIQLGVYLHNALDRIFFNRWLLEIELTERVSFFGGLKSRFGIADYIHIGVVYNLSKK